MKFNPCDYCDGDYPCKTCDLSECFANSPCNCCDEVEAMKPTRQYKQESREYTNKYKKTRQKNNVRQ